MPDRCASPINLASPPRASPLYPHVVIPARPPCCICLEPLPCARIATLLPCTHTDFHEECIRHWLLTIPACPICRSFTPGYLCADADTVLHVIDPKDICEECGILHEVCQECVRRHHDPEDCEWPSREEMMDLEWVPSGDEKAYGEDDDSKSGSGSGSECGYAIGVENGRERDNVRKKRTKFGLPGDWEKSDDEDDVEQDPDWVPRKKGRRIV